MSLVRTHITAMVSAFRLVFQNINSRACSAPLRRRRVFTMGVLPLLVICADAGAIGYYDTRQQATDACWADAYASDPTGTVQFCTDYTSGSQGDIRRFSYHGQINGTEPVADYMFPLTTCLGGHYVEPGVCTGPPIPIISKNNGLNCGGAVGNPCDAGSGNKVEIERDLITGAGPAIVRAYNSRYLLDSGWGIGWTTSLQSPRLNITNSSVQIVRADAKGETFNCVSNPCIGDADTRVGLTRTTDGYLLTLNKTGAQEYYDLAGKLTRETDPSGRTTRYTYDYSYFPDGILAAVTGPFGHRILIGNNTDGRLETLVDAGGNTISYGYDRSTRHLVRVTFPDRTAKLYYYEDPNYPHALTGIAYADVNAAGQLVNITRYANFGYFNDPVDYASLHNGSANMTEHSGGIEHFSLTYDSDTQTTATDAAGTREVMTFATNLGRRNLVSKVNLVDQKGLTQVFDAQNNLTCRKDEEGRVTTYTYNATNQKLSMTEGRAGNCTSPQTTAATRTTSYQYLSSTLDLPTIISSPSVAAGQLKTTAIQYGDSSHPNLPTRITQSGFTPSGASVSRTVTLAYNAMGQVIRVDGARADVNDATTLAYNNCTTGGGCGQLSSVTNAVGHVTSFDSYDGSGQLLQKTDANGLVTSYGYDPRGRVRTITQTPPSGVNRVTQYTYTAAGDMASATFPDGRTLTYSYSPARKLLQVADNLGNQVRYGYDAKGNRTQEYTYDPSNTLVRQMDLAHDARNHVAAINAAGSLTQTFHDALGNLANQIDPKGNPTANSYDALNRAIQSVNALGGVTQYKYDTQDNVKEVSAPNGVITRYQHDDLGNRLQEISPDRGTINYTHDSAGNVASITDARGITATYTYDALNRVTAVRYGAGGVSGFLSGLVSSSPEDVTYTYDQATGCSAGIGRLCSVSDASGSTTYSYDPFGNIAAVVHTELNVIYTTRYTYDAADRLSTVTYPDGRVVNYTRDAAGRIQAVNATVNNANQPIVSNRTYRADGLLAGELFGNGIAETRQYDLQGRLTNQYIGSADTRLYSYDANGNLVSEQANTQQGAYVYDPLDRLLQENVTNGATGLTDTNSFGYDLNGNRTSDLKANGNARPYRYAASSNRLIQVGNQATILDAAGNIASDRGGNRVFTYTDAGHLATVTVGGVLKGTYVYNAQHQRTRKSKVNQTFVYHYDLDGNLIAETKPDGTPVRSYIWAESQALAQIHYRGNTQTDVLMYLHTDHLGSPRLATDANQLVKWRWESEAFGTGRPDTDPDADGALTNVRLRLPGQFIDGESGLYYNWNRYYDPKMGRYVTSDPIGLDGGFNTYAYANLNPLRFVDPLGLAGQEGALPPSKIPGGPWTWHPDPNNSRGGTYRGAGGSSASWDREGSHWDVDDGKGGTRQRFDRWGNGISGKQAHSYKGPRQTPIRGLGCFGIVSLLVGVIADVLEDQQCKPEDYCS